MANPSANTPVLPSQKAVRRGVQIFIFCSIVGTLLGMWWKRPAGLSEIATRFDWRFWALVVPLIGLDYWLGGWRYRLFFNGKQLPFISQWNCMRANWANMFMGAATPFQTGGGAAQLYVLWKKGASVADSLLVSLVNYVATLLFFLISSIAAMTLLPDGLFGQNFDAVFRTSFGVIASVVSFVLIVMFFPKTGAALAQNLLAVLPLGKEKRSRWSEKVEGEARRFQEGFRKILRENKAGVALTFFATLWLYFNKYLIGYVIVRAIGQDVPFDIFIGIQVVQMLMLYFAPTPGASGLAEISTVWLMGTLMPESLLLVYAVLYRLATTMLAAVVGGAVLMQEIKN